MAATAEREWLSALQGLVNNRLSPDELRGRRMAVAIGDGASAPGARAALWNAGFEAIGLDAACVPLEVPRGRLAEVIAALRGGEAFLGGSVAPPYRREVVALLDVVDPDAARIGAVNLFVRTREGRLVGANTEGAAALRVLTDPASGIMAAGRLTNVRAILIGAGGAAQALAFHLWDEMTDGELLIANRTRAGAEGLAKRLAEMRDGRVSAIPEEGLAERVAWTDLVINASSKGQAGIRRLPDGRWTCLEPYSALAQAQPAALVAPASGEPAEFFQEWYRASAPELQRNHQISLQISARLPKSALCCDLIDEPWETPFLRHMRWSGHRTRNGVAVTLHQAADALEAHVCREWLEATGRDSGEVRGRIFDAMAAMLSREEKLRGSSAIGNRQ